MSLRSWTPFAGVALAVLAGCLVPVVVGERAPYWDGHSDVTFAGHENCGGCGHYDDGGWNLDPVEHVYVQAGLARRSHLRGRIDRVDRARRE